MLLITQPGVKRNSKNCTEYKESNLEEQNFEDIAIFF